MRISKVNSILGIIAGIIFAFLVGSFVGMARLFLKRHLDHWTMLGIDLLPPIISLFLILFFVVLIMLIGGVFGIVTGIYYGVYDGMCDGIFAGCKAGAFRPWYVKFWIFK